MFASPNDATTGGNGRYLPHQRTVNRMVQAGKVPDVHGVPPNRPRLFRPASFGAKLAFTVRKLTVGFLGSVSTMSRWTW